MKKTLLILASLLLWVCSSSAAVLLVEDFDYVAGTAIGELDGWTTTGTVSTGDGRVTNATVLEYSNAGGTYGQSGSKSLRHSYSVGENYISYKGFSKINSGAVYLTYMYKADGKQSQGQSELPGLTNSSSSPSARPWVGQLASGTTDGSVYRFGLTLSSGKGNDIKWSEGEYSMADVQLIVLKYDFVNSSAALFINPTLGTSEEPVANVTDNTGTVRSSIETLMFRNNGSSKANYYIGGVRVSTTWEEAVRAIETPPIGTASIATNFDDGTWGEIATTAYTFGSYPSSTINGFQLNAAGMLNKSINYAETEETFTNRISLDKMSNGGSVTLPAVSTIDQVNVYASTGTENQDIKLQQYNYRTGLWEDIDTYHFAEKAICYKFTTTINSNVAVRLRLVNASNGVKYIWKIETTPNVSKERLVYNFSDAVWSDLGTSSTTKTLNEVDFTECLYASGNYYATTAEKFTGRIQLTSSGNMMELPAVVSAESMDIYAASGSADKNLTVQQYNYYTAAWEDVTTLNFAAGGVYYRKTVTLNSESITRLRLVNADGSRKYVLKIVTYTSEPATLSAPETLAATNISAHSFTTNWNAVAGATGYRVIRYDNTGKLQRVETVGADITTFTFRDSGEKGVAPETDYSYAVVAIGDGETTVDSELSAPEAVTTAAEITDSYTRPVTEGNYGTICLPKASENLSTAGAVFFEVAGKVMVNDQLSEIVFDEVTSLEAGKPYVFLANSDELNITLVGDAVNDVVTSGTNGLKGSFTVKAISGGANKYVLSNNLLYCTNGREYYVGENRAYFDISSMSVFDPSAPKAPGRRRVSMKAEPQQTPTGIGAAETGSKPAKLLLNGSVVIIRNGVQYDITGQRIH